MKRYPTGFAGVVVLLGTSGPAAIAGLVVAVIVTSLYGVIWAWSKAHVGKEVLEGLPSLTNADASAAVAVISLVLGITAPAAQINPRHIFRRSGQPMRTVVFAYLSLKAAARLGAGSRLAVLEIVAAHQGRIAAVAQAFPLNAPANISSGWPQDNEPSEPLPRKVDHFWHANNLA